MCGENDLIIQDLISGSDKAFAEVYRNYHAQVYTYLLRRTSSVMMAEELLQLSFIKLWKNAGNLNPGLPLNVQLFRICRTVMIDEIRRQSTIKKTETFYFEQFQERSSSNEALTSQLSKDIHTALSELPPARKKIFELSRLEGYSHKEIAETMSISIRTVEDHIGKALKLLRRKLRDSILLFL
ncbi:sigma-70 family RNA polymerase sigma factor [Pedobacter sp. PLR]|uniref:RNA polymerase sigma factor n=1 Tax=Pedobacter sp. PLR TaxID=2994465 RepID=UPI0022459398|nr:sigma-70 family RNA polymerase sigma factor [Pedobacter sp. PLR]MCX2453338.1 sigma-70 family RNA polymerase sigma factor [Pedobacter sp. PLR]